VARCRFRIGIVVHTVKGQGRSAFDEMHRACRVLVRRGGFLRVGQNESERLLLCIDVEGVERVWMELMDLVQFGVQLLIQVRV